MGSVKPAAEVMMMLRVRGLVAVPPHLLLARPVPVVPRRTWWRAGMLAMQVAIPGKCRRRAPYTRWWCRLLSLLNVRRNQFSRLGGE